MELLRPILIQRYRPSCNACDRSPISRSANLPPLQEPSRHSQHSRLFLATQTRLGRDGSAGCLIEKAAGFRGAGGSARPFFPISLSHTHNGPHHGARRIVVADVLYRSEVHLLLDLLWLPHSLVCHWLVSDPFDLQMECMPLSTSADEPGPGGSKPKTSGWPASICCNTQSGSREARASCCPSMSC